MRLVILYMVYRYVLFWVIVTFTLREVFMGTEKFLIAGLKIEMTVRYELLDKQSRKYLCDFVGEPDFKIEAEESRMEILQRRSPVLNIAQREYICTAAAFYNNLLRFNGLMIHSSCISYGEKAYLFTADSGTGKSTHTSLWNEYIEGIGFINDDKPAVRLIDGEFFACGTPWSGKTDLSSNVGLPIGGIALLKRGKTNSITPASAKVAVLSLLKQTHLPPFNEGTDSLARLLDLLVRSTPIYDFACDISEDAVKTSFEAMTGEKYLKRT